MKKLCVLLVFFASILGGVFSPVVFEVQTSHAQQSFPTLGGDQDQDGAEDQIECPNAFDSFTGLPLGETEAFTCPDSNNDGTPDWLDPGVQFPNNNSNTSTPPSTSDNIEIDTSNLQNNQKGVLPSCGVIGESSISGCFVQLTYYAGLYPSSWMASWSGQLFDFFLSFSLSDDSYRSSIVEQGWRIVRDITNIAFIFAMLYIAISTILGINGRNTNKALARLILVALVINFSFFFSNIFIDVGNILGRAFYQSVEVPNESAVTQGGYKSLSVALLSNINPQGLLRSEIFNPERQNTTGNTLGDNTTASAISTGTNDNKAPSHGYMILLILTATIINLVLVWTFLSVCIFLIGRVIGLWLLIIFSPAAFLSIGLPFNLGQLDWKQWFGQLTNLAFLVPVFMFFLYLIVSFSGLIFGSENFLQIGEGSNTSQVILGILVPLFAIILFMQVARKQAKKMAGQAGEAVTKVLKTGALVAAGGAAIGVAGTAAAGGAVLRSTAGKAAQAGLKSEKYKNWAQKSRYGQLLTRKLKGVAENDFDLRNNRIAQSVGGKIKSTGSSLGINLNPGATAGFYKGTNQGGFTARQETKAATQKQRDEEFKEYLMKNETSKTTVDKTIKYKDNFGTQTVDASELKNISETEAKAKLAQKQRNVKEQSEDLKFAKKFYEISSLNPDGSTKGSTEQYSYDAIVAKILELEKAEKSAKEAYQAAERKYKTDNITKTELDFERKKYETKRANITNAQKVKSSYEKEWAKEKAIVNAVATQITKDNSQALHGLVDTMEKGHDAISQIVNFTQGSRKVSQNTSKNLATQYRNQAENLNEKAESQSKKQ